MIVIGYVYSLNGMASWCWEAANALHESGMEVVIVCKKEIKIPTGNKVEVIYINEEAVASEKSLPSKIVSQTLGRIRTGDSKMAHHIDSVLQNKGRKVDVYLWNDTSFFSARLSVSQFVVAWAYPSSLYSYLSKTVVFCKPSLSKEFLFTVLNSIGFYRKDRRAYHGAQGVLAVSQRLKKELLEKGYNATKVYPCIQVGNPPDPLPATDGKVHLVMSALDLEDKRKNIPWVLDCLVKYPVTNAMIHLIGNASEEFKVYYSDLLPVKFYGMLDRSLAINVLKNKDIFIFASLHDDWGYVQTEAMAKGMIVLAPDLSPFDEIVGDQKFLYQSENAEDLNRKLQLLIKEELSQLKHENYKRALSLFSRKVFADTIKHITKFDIKRNHTNLQ